MAARKPPGRPSGGQYRARPLAPDGDPAQNPVDAFAFGAIRRIIPWSESSLPASRPIISKRDAPPAVAGADALSGYRPMVEPKADGRSGAAQERRRFERFSTRLDVAARRDDLVPRPRPEAGHAAHCRMELRDFSLDGVRAESAVRLKTGEHVTVRLPPNGRQPPLELTGRVVHCRREHDRYQIGIQFAQTREGASASPWWQLPRLFSLAHGAAQAGRLDYLSS